MRIRFLSDVFVAVPSSLRKLTIVKRKIVSITLTEQYSMLIFFFFTAVVVGLLGLRWIFFSVW